MHRDDTVSETVLRLADAEPELAEDTKLMILEAMTGDADLHAALDKTFEKPFESPVNVNLPPEPVGAFLNSITVSGFRGIGQEATLTLRPAPGLTVISGRNGSGKSSFSEALEVALTGDSYRWKTKRSAVWKEPWRNLHQRTECWIQVRIAEEGQRGATTVGVEWADGANLADRRVWVQRRGQPRQDADTLGWRRPMELFRPMLSYDELGALLEAEPSKLYDALAGILGLDQMTDAQKRLTEAARQLGVPRALAKQLGDELKPTLAGMSDPRAAQALTLLTKQVPDLDALEQLATGTTSHVSDELAGLRALTRLRVPEAAEVSQAANELHKAREAVVQASDTSVDLLERRTALLERALALHEHHGEMACPVCGVGSLDGQWRARTAAELADGDARLQELRQARERLTQRRRALSELIRTVPVLPPPGPFELATYAAAEEAWKAWPPAQVPEVGQPENLQDLEIARGRLQLAAAKLGEEAAALLAKHDDAWAPVATRLAEWVTRAREARANEPTLKQVKKAADWLKRNGNQLRNERLEPLATEARRIWAELRQESDVDLGAITLEGQNTKRRVILRADVDGTAADSALGVMSQGELHALALALFLPRATAPTSPFRFVVLDDPIQAMDPAKIDGFVRVLARLATDRQVIVLSHDDRLAQAVRYLRVEARILEVHRAANSKVEISTGSDPADRYLEDARALVLDEQVPEEVWRRIVPALCRLAVESAARDAFMARRFGEGAERSRVESEWEAAKRTRQRVTLAIPDGPESLSRWEDRGPRREVLNICGRNSHTPLEGDPIVAIENTVAVVSDLRDGRR